MPWGHQQPIDGFEPGGFHLVVSRLKTYKNVDTIIAAFNLRCTPLVVVGEGTEADSIAWDPDAIRAHAAAFSPAGFRRRMQQIVAEELRHASP